MQQRLARREVEAEGADVLSNGRLLLDGDRIAFAFRVFLDDDGIGAGRYWSAGRDTHGFTGPMVPEKECPAADSPMSFSLAGVAEVSVLRTA